MGGLEVGLHFQGATEPAPGSTIGPRTAGQENVFLHAPAPSPSPSRFAHRPWIVPWGPWGMHKPHRAHPGLGVHKCCPFRPPSDNRQANARRAQNPA